MKDEIKSRLTALADRLLRNSLQTTSSDVPAIVYHYTNASGVFGILQSGNIWATDSRFLNDKSESYHSKNIVETIYQSKISNSKDASEIEFLKNALAYSGMEDLDNAHIFSLSEDEDDLSQWRSYGGDGAGFTIGFCGKSLRECALADDAVFTFSKVEYDSNKKSEEFGRYIDIFQSEIFSLISTYPDMRSLILNIGCSQLEVVLSTRAFMNKHRSFRSEKEWRLLSFEDKADVRIRQDRLVPYLEIDYWSLQNKKLPIKRIGVGPGFTGTEDKFALEALCKRCGYNPEIYFADTPYRRL